MRDSMIDALRYLREQHKAIASANCAGDDLAQQIVAASKCHDYPTLEKLADKWRERQSAQNQVVKHGL